MSTLLTIAKPASNVELLSDDFNFDLLIINTLNSYSTSEGTAILNEWEEPQTTGRAEQAILINC